MKQVDVVKTCAMSKMRIQVLLLLTLCVVFTDAWFWAWTGTTTLAPTPTVDTEGSGSPVGSGELPSENFATVGAEINDEGHGIQKAAQTWDETTKAPLLTSISQLQDEHGSEKETAGISSNISKPGNSTTSLKISGSEGSVYLKLTGNISRLEPVLDSELAPDAGSGLWSGSGFRSESGFGSDSETSFGIEEKQQEVMRADSRRLDSRNSVVSQTDELKLESQKTNWITHNITEEHRDSGNAKSEQNLDFPDKTPNHTRENTKINSNSTWNARNFNLTEYVHQGNSNHGDLITPDKSNNSVNTTQIIKSNQPWNITQIAASESTTKQKALTNQVLETTSASSTRQVLSLNQTPATTPKTLLSQLQMAIKEADTTSVPSVQSQVLDQASATTQEVITSHFHHISNTTHTSLSNKEPIQATLIRQTSESDVKLAKSPQVIESPQCLLLDNVLPFCSSMAGERFVVPNYLNQSTVEEIQILLNNWTWLLGSHCHHSLEWFFCLLLVPKCGSLAPLLPCRSFCEVLRDSCWTLLDEGHLPVECHTLPEDDDDGYQCLSVSNQKGNHWLK